jgi:hypothetical protein
LIEFLHLAFSQECAEIFYVLGFFKYSGYHEFFLIFFYLVSVVISDWYMLPNLLLLLGLVFQGLGDCLFRDILIFRLTNSTFTHQHVLDCLLRVDQVPNLDLWEWEVRTQTVVNKLVSLMS